MLRRAPWIILLIMAATIAIDFGIILDKSVPRQQILVVNIFFLFLLGATSILFVWEYKDAYFQLKNIVEKLQTPGGYLHEDLDLEEQPNEAFLKTLDSLGHEARARLSCQVETGPAGQP